MSTISAPVFQFLWQCCKTIARNYFPHVQSLKTITLPQSVSKNRVQTGISKLKFTINILVTEINCLCNIGKVCLVPARCTGWEGKREVSHNSSRYNLSSMTKEEAMSLCQ